jgi:hypothetical protein
MPNTRYDHWFHNRWRPAMGWMYLLVCVCDFVFFPVWWTMFQASMQMQIQVWNPLTLQGAGLFHMAMGAIVGVTAWNRTREKMANATGDTD